MVSFNHSFSLFSPPSSSQTRCFPLQLPPPPSPKLPLLSVLSPVIFSDLSLPSTSAAEPASSSFTMARRMSFFVNSFRRLHASPKLLKERKDLDSKNLKDLWAEKRAAEIAKQRDEIAKRRHQVDVDAKKFTRAIGSLGFGCIVATCTLAYYVKEDMLRGSRTRKDRA